MTLQNWKNNPALAPRRGRNSSEAPATCRHLYFWEVADPDTAVRVPECGPPLVNGKTDEMNNVQQYLKKRKEYFVKASVISENNCPNRRPQKRIGDEWRECTHGAMRMAAEERRRKSANP